MEDDELDFDAGIDWRELEAGHFVGKNDLPVPERKRERKLGHKAAWRHLFVGLFIKSRPRDVAFLVVLVWLCMGVVLFFAMQLIGYIYQQTLSPILLSGYTERYVGCWFAALFAVALGFTRMFMVWFRYRCC